MDITTEQTKKNQYRPSFGLYQRFLEEQRSEKETLKMTSIRLPPELIAEIDRQVEAGGWQNRSMFIRRLIVISLALSSPEVANVEQAIGQILRPMMEKSGERIGELLGQIISHIPKELIRELVTAVVDALTPYFVRTMGVSGELFKQAIFEIVGQIGEDQVQESQADVDEAE